MHRRLEAAALPSLPSPTSLSPFLLSSTRPLPIFYPLFIILPVRLLSRLVEMIYMMLYEEESQGLKGPEKVSTRWPARCHVIHHVTRR